MKKCNSQSLTEYTLILVLIALSCTVALGTLGQETNEQLQLIANALSVDPNATGRNAISQPGLGAPAFHNQPTKGIARSRALSEENDASRETEGTGASHKDGNPDQKLQTVSVAKVSVKGKPPN